MRPGTMGRTPGSRRARIVGKKQNQKTVADFRHDKLNTPSSKNLLHEICNETTKTGRFHPPAVDINHIPSRNCAEWYGPSKMRKYIDVESFAKRAQKSHIERAQLSWPSWYWISFSSQVPYLRDVNFIISQNDKYDLD